MISDEIPIITISRMLTKRIENNNHQKGREIKKIISLFDFNMEVPHPTYKNLDPILLCTKDTSNIHPMLLNIIKCKIVLYWHITIGFSIIRHLTMSPGLIPEDRLLERVLGSQEHSIANRLCHLQLAGYKNSQEYSRECHASPA